MINKVHKDLSGILVAIVTPWKNDTKEINAEAYKQHIDWMIDTGVHGIVAGGSTGEFSAMTMDERKQMVELCVEYAAGRVPVVAGTGALTTKDCLELAEHASQVGVSALMVVPPFYDPVNIDQLHELLSEISTVSNLPLMYYNIPGASGLTLSPEQIAGLAKSGVKYMKDTSGNAPALTELLFERHEELTTFNGWDTLTFYGLAAGAKGSVWGATNIIPELSVQLWDAVAVRGDLKLGREVWAKIFPICKFLESVHYVSAVKTGMELRGMDTGGVRKPWTLLSGDQKQELARLMKNAGLDVKA